MITKKKTTLKKKAPPVAAATPCSASELAARIADEILTVGASGDLIRCSRAVMMKGKYPDGERNMGGRNHASIAFVIREHLLAAGFPPDAEPIRSGGGVTPSADRTPESP